MKKYPKKTIGELCHIQKGETGIVSATPGEYPLVTTGKERKTSATYQFDTQAVCIPLVSSSGHGKKSLNYVHYQEGKFALGTILAAIIPKNNTDISAAFLHQYLLFYKNIKIVPLMRGAANVSLAVKDIAKIEVPIPPINEQKDFIFLFNKLKKFNDLLIQEFDSQEKYISQLKQAILQEAIAGKLTAEWRDRNPMQKGDPDTDAAALLAKIKAEKQQAIADRKLKQEKPLPKISPDEIPFCLPDSWVWCRLGEICDVQDPNPSHRMPKYSQEGIPFISPMNVSKNGNIDFTKGKCVLEETLIIQKSIFSIQEHSFAFSRIGTIGKTFKLPLPQNYCLSHSLSVLTPVLKEENKFFMKLLSSNTILSQASKGVTHNTVPDLGMKTIRAFLCPLPPLAEQKVIVEKVDYLMKIIDQLEEQIKHRKQLAEDLMQTVLREAFE